MEDNYSDFYSQIESMVGKKTMSKKAFHFSIKAAPRRSFTITKTDGKIQIILDELRPGEDHVGSLTYAALGANKSADKLTVIYAVSDNQMTPVFAQLGVLKPLYQGQDADSLRQLAAFGTMVSNELKYGNYGDVIKMGSGIFYIARSNLNLKDVRYEAGDIIPEAEFKKLDAHYQSKFIPLEVKISETVPKEQIQTGAPLSTKTGWLCRANINTADDVKFVRGQIYSEEEMKRAPKDKLHKFIQTGKPVMPTTVPA